MIHPCFIFPDLCIDSIPYLLWLPTSLISCQSFHANSQESVVFTSTNGDTSVEAANAVVDPGDAEPDDTNEAPDEVDPAVVNPAITVIQTPAIIQPVSQTPVTGAPGVGEMNQMNGRMKTLEGQVQGLMEALEAWWCRLVCLVVDSFKGKLCSFHKRFGDSIGNHQPQSGSLRFLWSLLHLSQLWIVETYWVIFVDGFAENFNLITFVCCGEFWIVEACWGLILLFRVYI